MNELIVCLYTKERFIDPNHQEYYPVEVRCCMLSLKMPDGKNNITRMTAHSDQLHHCFRRGVLMVCRDNDN